MPEAIEGMSGSRDAFKVAQVITRGFALGTSDLAYDVFEEYNQRCVPVWEPHEIDHKLKSSFETGRMPIGILRDAQKPLDVHITEYTEHKQHRFITSKEAIRAFAKDLDTGKRDLIPLGIDTLDEVLGGGVRPGSLSLICGPTSHGKTAVLLHIVESFASRGNKCLVISKEMTHDDLAERLTQRYIGGPVERGNAMQIAKMREDSLEYDNIWIADQIGGTEDVIDAIKEAKEKFGIDTVFVDYLQLLKDKGKDLYEQASNTSKAIAECCKNERVTTICISQFNREFSKREGGFPILTDIRESGQIEQDFDLIVGIVWPWKKNPLDKEFSDDPWKQHVIELYVMKRRTGRGANEKASVLFLPASQRFVYDVRKIPGNEPKRHSEFDNYDPTQQVLGIDEEV
jgi:replicative DNA helicase